MPPLKNLLLPKGFTPLETPAMPLSSHYVRSENARHRFAMRFEISTVGQGLAPAVQIYTNVSGMG